MTQHPTYDFRWLRKRETTTEPDRLQQRFISTLDGSEEWKDVPTVLEEVKAVHVCADLADKFGMTRAEAEDAFWRLLYGMKPDVPEGFEAAAKAAAYDLAVLVRDRNNG